MRILVVLAAFSAAVFSICGQAESHASLQSDNSPALQNRFVDESGAKCVNVEEILNQAVEVIRLKGLNFRDYISDAHIVDQSSGVSDDWLKAYGPDILRNYNFEDLQAYAKGVSQRGCRTVTLNISPEKCAVFDIVQSSENEIVLRPNIQTLLFTLAYQASMEFKAVIPRFIGATSGQISKIMSDLLRGQSSLCEEVNCTDGKRWRLVELLNLIQLLKKSEVVVQRPDSNTLVIRKRIPVGDSRLGYHLVYWDRTWQWGSNLAEQTSVSEGVEELKSRVDRLK